MMEGFLKCVKHLASSSSHNPITGRKLRLQKAQLITLETAILKLSKQIKV